MLESETKLAEASPDYHNIIRWSNSGIAFGILDVALFASVILPKYFRTSKFSSFQRNLNLYGFSKVRRGADADMYAHPDFIRGKAELLMQLLKCNTPAATRRVPSNSSFDSNSAERTSVSTNGSEETLLASTLSKDSPPRYVTLQPSYSAIPTTYNAPVLNFARTLPIPAWNQPVPHTLPLFPTRISPISHPVQTKSMLGPNKLALLAMAMTSIEASRPTPPQKA